MARREGAVLGISADYHDAAAALVVDGQVVAAAAEERFTRRKHDPSLPVHALRWCLDDAGVAVADLAAVVFYEKPVTAYERMLRTTADVGPRAAPALARSLSSHLGRRLWVAYRIERALGRIGPGRPPVWFSEHHLSHAAAAFHPSPFPDSAILTMDGVGEWATTTIGHGDGHRVHLELEQRFPDSPGLLYAALTAHCGFAVNDGEYKLMGLAPYGEPRFAEALLEQVVHLDDDGTLALDQRYFDYRAGRRMTSRRLEALLGPPRSPGEPVDAVHADVAASAQVVLERWVLAAARRAVAVTGRRRLCLAGGVALNCVANRRLLASGTVDELWVQPASGDDGGALGAALWGWHDVLGHERRLAADGRDGMAGAFLGPRYDAEDVRAWLAAAGVPHEALDEDELADRVAAALADGAIVGWFRGRMEFGPRALGHRSILADPRDAAMVGRLNQRVKGREGFRPFAPAVLAEAADQWFMVDRPQPYMLVTAGVRGAVPAPPGPGGVDPATRLGSVRSPLPAATHVDGSARVQTVEADTNPELHRLLRAFERRTGTPVLLNTSFNRADEPIVRTPADALRCARAAGLDLLVLERCLVRPRDAVGRAA